MDTKMNIGTFDLMKFLQAVQGSFVGVIEKDGVVEAVYKTKKGDYKGVDLSGNVKKYLTDPTVRQPSLFWRGTGEGCSVDTLAANTTPMADALNCIRPAAKEAMPSLIEALRKEYTLKEIVIEKKMIDPAKMGPGSKIEKE
jgi:hypothetical protein